MDQGIAAVAAGIAGLLGAGIGGLAAAYGARIGAQNTIEAARTQVDRQATAEHLHWIREQRRQAYSAIMEAHLAVSMTIDDCHTQLIDGSALPDDTISHAKGQLMNLATTVARANLWGPDDLVNKARELISAEGEAIGMMIAWSMAVETDDQDLIQAVRQGLPEIRSSTLQHAFVTAVRQELAAPVQ
ncbi:hypothetical protein AB0B12_35405 [Streptomyces sp. NPDC044780]|uniref:hypothetical protein n=1 Tax=unclassified Streptomyces TaxID=2593676 RepID=UPI00340B4654